MNDSTEIFIDGVGKIGISNGAVRCELISVGPKERDETVNIRNCLNIVMAPQGLIQITNVLNDFVRQLEEKGVIIKKENND